MRFITAVSIKKENAITLVEIMIAAFVLVIGIVGSLKFFTSAIASTEYARDITAATTHGRYIMEEMRLRTTLTNITATDWSGWSQQQGLNTLPSQAVNVYFSNPTADPLNVQTTITWVRRDRTNDVSFITELTK